MTSSTINVINFIDSIHALMSHLYTRLHACYKLLIDLYMYHIYLSLFHLCKWFSQSVMFLIAMMNIYRSSAQAALNFCVQSSFVCSRLAQLFLSTRPILPLPLSSALDFKPLRPFGCSLVFHRKKSCGSNV